MSDKATCADCNKNMDQECVIGGTCYPLGGYYCPFFDPIDPQSTTALSRQVGGSHYKDYKIQPWEFFFANNLPFHQADPIKRILRYNKPTGKGKEDIDKVIHEMELIKESEGWE